MALQIVDDEGAEALSMRTLAQRLESGTAKLYRHFANRGEVIAHVVDRVFGEVEFSTKELAKMGWQRACESYGRSMFEVLGRHHNVAPLLVEHVPIGPNAMAQRDVSRHPRCGRLPACAVEGAIRARTPG